MKIEQLQQLLAVVEEGSMNEAAQKLYVARSSLSTSMKNLESCKQKSIAEMRKVP